MIDLNQDYIRLYIQRLTNMQIKCESIARRNEQERDIHISVCRTRIDTLYKLIENFTK